MEKDARLDGFGTRLKKLRRNADMTQGDLAKELDVVPSAVGKYERMPNSFPSVDVLVGIANHFHVSTDYLLLGESAPAGIENNINGSMTNSSVVQANNGSVIVNSRALSPEATELLRIYEALGGRERLKLLNFAVGIEEDGKKQ